MGAKPSWRKEIYAERVGIKSCKHVQTRSYERVDRTHSLEAVRKYVV